LKIIDHGNSDNNLESLCILQDADTIMKQSTIKPLTNSGNSDPMHCINPLRNEENKSGVGGVTARGTTFKGEQEDIFPRF
jgi:hypothetical protein